MEASFQHKPKLMKRLIALMEERAMSYRQKRFTHIAVAFSFMLNIFFLYFFIFSKQPFQKGWALTASKAAQEASYYDCSGHGDLYVDTFQADSHQVCECNECFQGPNCADPVPNCEANVDSGNPLLFEPFWRKNAEASSVVIPGWYRMGYEFVEGKGLTSSPALEKEIRRLHKLVGNAVTDGRYIVIGTGSMQLLNAAVSSLAPDSGDAASVVSAVPYYGAYRSQMELFQTSHYTWKGDARVFAQSGDHVNETSTEFVNLPNNPDGTIRQPIINGSKAYAVYDYAYYWAHYTPITKPADNEVMLFTLSKVTGHAGSRIGWAIIKDENVYKRLLKYILLNVLSVSHESQFRATQLLRFINDGYSKSTLSGDSFLALQSPMFYAANNMLFHYGYAKMRYRWETLNKVLNDTTRFNLQHFEPEYCRFFKKFTKPYPAYAWVQCNGEVEDCLDFFQKFGIIGRSGSEFGDNGNYIRLSLLIRDSTFENLVKHLRFLSKS